MKHSRAGLLSATVILAITLAGCSSSGYNSADEIRAAFVAAGGGCEEQGVMDATALQGTASGVYCSSESDGVTQFIIFPSSEARAEFFSDANSRVGFCQGETWAAYFTEDSVASKYASLLGCKF